MKIFVKPHPPLPVSSSPTIGPKVPAAFSSLSLQTTTQERLQTRLSRSERLAHDGPLMPDQDLHVLADLSFCIPGSCKGIGQRPTGRTTSLFRDRHHHARACDVNGVVSSHMRNQGKGKECKGGEILRLRASLRVTSRILDAFFPFSKSLTDKSNLPRTGSLFSCVLYDKGFVETKTVRAGSDSIQEYSIWKHSIHSLLSSWVCSNMRI